MQRCCNNCSENICIIRYNVLPLIYQTRWKAQNKQTMTTKQMAEKINNQYWAQEKFRFVEAKAWENYGKVRIYIGREFVDIKNGKATASTITPTRGFYESREAHSVRAEQWAKLTMPIDVVARYVQMLLNK